MKSRKLTGESCGEELWRPCVQASQVFHLFLEALQPSSPRSAWGLGPGRPCPVKEEGEARVEHHLLGSPLYQVQGHCDVSGVGLRTTA